MADRRAEIGPDWSSARRPRGPAGASEAKQRERARELRLSPWWKRRIADGVCHYCRRPVGRTRLTMDHVVPLGRGGRSTRGNVVPACKDCNNAKKWMLPVEWGALLDRLSTARDLD